MINFKRQNLSIRFLFCQSLDSRSISTSRVCFGCGGLRQPLSHQKQLKFGKEIRPVKRSKSLHQYKQLPPIPYEPSFTPNSNSYDNTANDKALDAFKQRQKSQGPSVLNYKVPVMIVEGRGQYLFDEKGNRYLDMFGFDGLIHVGHCHPSVKDAIQKQATKLTHVSHHFLSEELKEFSEVI